MAHYEEISLNEISKENLSFEECDKFIFGENENVTPENNGFGFNIVFSKEINNQKSKYISSTKEYLDSLRVCIIAVRREPENSKIIDSILVISHVICGDMIYFKKSEITLLFNEIKILLESAKKNEITLNNNFFEILFDTVNLIECFLKNEQGESKKLNGSLSEELSKILNRMQLILPVKRKK